MDEKTYLQLVRKIEEYMIVDEHNRDEEFYGICNIYYDTLDDRLIRASIEKPVYKEKFRLRSYGQPELDDCVFMEIKKKYKGTVNKRRTGIKLNEAYAYLNENRYPKQENCLINEQVLHEIDYFKNFYQLIPKVYLSYERRAYFEKEDGDFRVTFDTNIVTRRYELKLEYGSYGEKLLPEGAYLMEIKANKAVPVWFAKVISELKLYPISFSKYGSEYKKYVMQNHNQNFNFKGEQLCLNQFFQAQQQIHPSALARQC
jgi:hypothetical protein